MRERLILSKTIYNIKAFKLHCLGEHFERGPFFFFICGRWFLQPCVIRGMLKRATPCGRSLKQPLVFGPDVMVCGMLYLQKCCALSLLKQINSRKQMTANINMYFGKENKSKELQWLRTQTTKMVSCCYNMRS